jgi:hypothetical protein
MARHPEEESVEFGLEFTADTNAIHATAAATRRPTSPCTSRGRRRRPAQNRYPDRPAHTAREAATVFFFFSNRLGCFGSLLLSLVITVVLILLLMH